MPHIKIIVMAAIGRLAARRAYSKVGEKWVMHFTKTAVAATTTSPHHPERSHETAANAVWAHQLVSHYTGVDPKRGLERIKMGYQDFKGY